MLVLEGYPRSWSENQINKTREKMRDRIVTCNMKNPVPLPQIHCGIAFHQVIVCSLKDDLLRSVSKDRKRRPRLAFFCVRIPDDFR